MCVSQSDVDSHMLCSGDPVHAELYAGADEGYVDVTLGVGVVVVVIGVCAAPFKQGMSSRN